MREREKLKSNDREKGDTSEREREREREREQAPFRCCSAAFVPVSLSLSLSRCRSLTSCQLPPCVSVCRLSDHERARAAASLRLSLSFACVPFFRSFSHFLSRRRLFRTAFAASAYALAPEAQCSVCALVPLIRVSDGKESERKERKRGLRVSASADRSSCSHTRTAAGKHCARRPPLPGDDLLLTREEEERRAIAPEVSSMRLLCARLLSRAREARVGEGVSASSLELRK